MHEQFMKSYGDYLIENYSDLSNMTKQDLCDVKEIAKTMEHIFSADKEYNIVKSMEERDDYSDVDMNWDEFITRFTRMYNNADVSTKLSMKNSIMGIF